jgi:hypothetical protein
VLLAWRVDHAAASPPGFSVCSCCFVIALRHANSIPAFSRDMSVSQPTEQRGAVRKPGR